MYRKVIGKLKRGIEFCVHHILLLCLPYSLGVRIINGCARSSILHRTLFQRKLKALQRFLVLNPLVDRDVAIRRFLIANGLVPQLYRWRIHAAQRARWEVIQAGMEIKGMERLVDAEQKGRGVVLVCAHFGVTSLLPGLYARLGRPVLVLAHTDFAARMCVKVSENLTVVSMANSFLPQVLFRAQSTLKEGGSVLILPDGRIGSSAATCGFMGRSLPFRNGFATLAINSGASVLPTRATVDEKGFMTIEFQQELDLGCDTSPKSLRVKSALDQYVRWVEECWLTDPGNILEKHLNRFWETPLGQREGRNNGTDSSSSAMAIMTDAPE